MPLQASDDFGANYFNPTNRSTRFIHNHLFPAANTGIAHIRDSPTSSSAPDFLKIASEWTSSSQGGTIDSPLLGPLRPKVPALKPGKSYLLEVVLRTLTLGHPLTQGTVDSNELWVDVNTSSGGKTIGRSGGVGQFNEVDPWSHFVNVYMLDKDGNRIDRRNPQDIFTPLYNNQIPPGAAQVAHYAFTVPEDLTAPLTFEVKFQYRKFDTIYMNYVFGKSYTNGAPFQFTNDLPITPMASDRITFPIEGGQFQPSTLNPQPSTMPDWQRWNDYSIGLLLKGDKGSEKGELVQAAQAFSEVEKLGRADGPLNLARVYFKEGGWRKRSRLFSAPTNSTTCAAMDGRVVQRTGKQAERLLDKAITEFAASWMIAIRVGQAGIRFQQGLRSHQRAWPDSVRTGQDGTRRSKSGAPTAISSSGESRV